VAAFRELGHEVRVAGLTASDGATGRRGLVQAIRRAVPQVLFELASFGVDIPDYFDVRRHLRQFQPDFVYKRHGRNDVGALFAARAAGVPLILEVNCLFSAPQYEEFEPLRLSRFTAALERRAMRMARAVLAVSTPLARQIAALSGVEAVVVPNGADTRRFDPSQASPDAVRARYGLGEAVIVGWAGVIREWHGLELLLDALAAVPGLRLLIVGDGPARSGIEEGARRRGVIERLTVTGRIPFEEMRDHIAVMDIAVVAADRTGVASPMKLLEYMAMGKPVVAPDLENLRDVLTHGANGLLFVDGDRASLAEALRTLAGDASLRRRLGEAARRTVFEQRNWRHIAEQVVSIVQPGASQTGLGRTVLH
jgi:glycosyltransferase involved in cell wall biosynthesis